MKGASAALSVGLCVAVSCEPDRGPGRAPRAGQRLSGAPLPGLRARRARAVVRERRVHRDAGAHESLAVDRARRRLVSGPGSDVSHGLEQGGSRLQEVRSPGLQPAALRVAGMDGGSELLSHRTPRRPRGSLDFGNENEGSVPTALPVCATFRPLFGSPAQDAIDLGLLLDPIAGQSLAVAGGIPGPNNTVAVQFRARTCSGPVAATSARWSRTRRTSRSFRPRSSRGRRTRPSPSTTSTRPSKRPRSTAAAPMVPTFEIARARRPRWAGPQVPAQHP